MGLQPNLTHDCRLDALPCIYQVQAAFSISDCPLA